MTISIVIPNYNGQEILAKNLPKVIQCSSGADIIVVDDASIDGSVAMLKKNFPNVKIIEKTKNEGFASTVNLGVKEAKSDLVLLLNSDVETYDNFLSPLIKHFEDPNVYAVGCAQVTRQDYGQAYIEGRGIGRFEKGFLIHTRGEPSKKDTLWVAAGAAIFRKSIWEKLGGLSEIYNPFYWEDIDISYRALKSGYKLIFEPSSQVKHTQKEGAIRIYYKDFFIETVAYRNQILFVWLNITDTKYLINHLLYLPIHTLKSLIFLDFAFIIGLFKAILLVPQVISQRKNNKKLFIKKDSEIFQLFQNED